jgi:DNA-binding MarR family transcriptional regulator
MQRPSREPSLGDCLEIEKRCLGLNLRRADRLVSQVYDAALRKVGLKNTQFGLLVCIRAMQPVPLSRLAQRMDLDRTTLTRNLAPLEDRGLVSTSQGSDKRERILSLTAGGAADLSDAYPLWKAAQAKIEERMGEHAAVSLIAGLRTLSATVA